MANTRERKQHSIWLEPSQRDAMKVLAAKLSARFGRPVKWPDVVRSLGEHVERHKAMPLGLVLWSIGENKGQK